MKDWRRRVVAGMLAVLLSSSIGVIAAQRDVPPAPAPAPTPTLHQQLVDALNLDVQHMNPRQK